MNTRQPRQTTFLPVRLRCDGAWGDVIIRNVSAKGAMLETAAMPPRMGSFVEVRRATSVIVAQVRWTTANRCGIRTREVIDIDALTAGVARESRSTTYERRLFPRDERGIDPAIVGRWLQHGVLAVAVIFSACMLAGMLYRQLNGVTAQISTALHAN